MAQGKQTTSYLSFNADLSPFGDSSSGWNSFPTTTSPSTAAAFGRPGQQQQASNFSLAASSNQPSSQSQRRSPNQRPLPGKVNVVDPLSESIFPIPQTPPKMKPRPSALQVQNQQAAGGAAGGGSGHGGLKSYGSAGSNAAALNIPASPLGGKSPGGRYNGIPISPGGRNNFGGSSPTPRKRCAFTGCSNDRFARGYCALHLSEVAARNGMSDPVQTPTTKIRNVHKLWHRDLQMNKETHINTCQWEFIHNDDSHTIYLEDNTFTGSRLIMINNKEVYNSHPEIGPFKLDATIGTSFKNTVNIKLIAIPQVKGYDYELFIDELRFNDAHQSFLAKLSGTTMIQRMDAPAGKYGTKQQIVEQQLKETLYVKQNWSQLTDEEKGKSLASGMKSKVTWNFTVRGMKHVVVLEYTTRTGKKKVFLDGELIAEKKSSLISTNKHKRWKHVFLVDGIECIVSTCKNKSPDPVEVTNRPFIFSFDIDGVPFESCLLTETDLAGGNTQLDDALRNMSVRGDTSQQQQQQQPQAQQKPQRPNSAGTSHSGLSINAASTKSSSNNTQFKDGVSSPVKRSGRRNSIHKPLSSEEYEQQMAEENERDRADEEKRKKEKMKGQSNGYYDPNNPIVQKQNNSAVPMSQQPQPASSPAHGSHWNKNHSDKKDEFKIKRSGLLVESSSEESSDED